MPVYPLRFAPIVKSGRYPHMARRDFVIWERWIDAHAREYSTVAYDVAVGGVFSSIPTATRDQQRGFQYNTALKLDALLTRPDGWTIAEVKPEANVSAVGACLCYRTLLLREIPTLPTAELLIVCEFASADMEACAAELGIRIDRV